jgi:hypothetical protein
MREFKMFNTNNPPFQFPLPTQLLTAVVQSAAAAELRFFLPKKAAALRDETDLRWAPSEMDLPSCRELNHQVAVALATDSPLPLSDVRADRTFVLNRDAEMCLRFWRLLRKFQQELCRCDAPSEHACDSELVDEAIDGGLGYPASAYLYADLSGRTFLRSAGYGLSIDPCAYTLDIVMFGFPEALVMEQTRRDEARAHGLEPAA